MRHNLNPAGDRAGSVKFRMICHFTRWVEYTFGKQALKLSGKAEIISGGIRNIEQAISPS